MDNNRIIAEWAGWRREDSKGEWWSVPGIGRMDVVPVLDTCIGMELWHSTLFPLIESTDRDEERSGYNTMLARFGGCVLDIVFRNRGVSPVVAREEIDLTAGFLLLATPAQLTEALVALIKERRWGTNTKGGEMKKEFTVHQYVIQNMQEMCMPNYLISKLYYPSIMECKKDWELGSMFKVGHAYRKSKASGRIAHDLWRCAKCEREKRRIDGC